MMNLLFSPGGRITSAEFMRGATVLVIFGLLASLAVLISPVIGLLLSLVSLVTLWCWVVLWRKRYHDGGKSGWNGLIPIVVWLVLGTIISLVLAGMFVDAEAVAAAEEAMNEAGEAGDIGALFSAALGSGNSMTTVGTIVSSLAMAGISYGVAMVFNNMIKGDPHDNQYGPNPNSADTFS